MSRILVTGGAGRLGRSVVAALVRAGHDVTSVDRSGGSVDGAASISCELGDTDSVLRVFRAERPDVVVHLAGIATPFSAPEQVIFETNTALAFSVKEAAAQSGASAVLFCSSPTVIGYNAPAGWSPDRLPIDEDHPVAPWNAYSLAKCAIEEIVAAGVRSGTGLRLGVFRPSYVIAPEEWHGAPTQQGHTIRERLDHPELAAVSLFNYVDARDAGDFVAAWVDRAGDTPNGTTFFVGADDSLVREPVGDALAKYVPGIGTQAAGLPSRAAVFSSARAQRLLGWRARRSWRTELDEGLQNP